MCFGVVKDGECFPLGFRLVGYFFFVYFAFVLITWALVALYGKLRRPGL